MTYQFKPSRYNGYKRNVKPSEALKGTPLGERPVLFIAPSEMLNSAGWCYRNQVPTKDFLALINSGKIVVSKDGQPRQSETLSRETNADILAGIEVRAAAAAKEARARGETVEVLGVSEIKGVPTYNPLGSGEETRKGTYRDEKGHEYNVINSQVRGVTDATRKARGLTPLAYETVQAPE